MTFPLASPPAGYVVCSFPNNRAGIFYTTDTPTVTLSAPTSCNYSVRDYFGNVVSTGTVSGASTVTPGAPVGGWKPGWYRFYLDGTAVDPVYGTSLGASNFMVIRDDSRFPPLPALGYGTGKSAANSSGGEGQDEITKSILGMGSPSRRQISNASTPGTPGLDAVSKAEQIGPYIQAYWVNPTHTQYLDSERPRTQWIQFPNRTYDRVTLGFSNVYCLDETIDGTKVFVEMTGSSPNLTVNVYFPDAVTLVETYTGISSGAALDTATIGSAYIRTFAQTSAPVATSPTAIGNAFSSGVQTTVADLYPFGYTHYEGPINEGVLTAETAHRMRLFQANVHAGNASAKAIGPCFVQIDNGHLNGTSSWDTFLAAGGGTYCDEFSTHAYNSVTNGNLPQGQVIMQAWVDKLTQYGQESKPRWISESTNIWTSVAGVLHPRRARVILLTVMLQEQYGIPREQNLIWYDQEHGFVSFPSWNLNFDNSMQPYATMMRVLAEETFGLPYSSKLDFGNDVANAMFIGNVYTAGTNSVIGLIAGSHIDNATVTLAITGTTSPLTVVDAFGNTSTVTPSGGKVTVPIDDIPTYVELPSGASATVNQVLDWETNPQDSISTAATTFTVGGTNAPAIADGGWITNYGGTITGEYTSPNALPEDAIILFPSSHTIGHVVIFAGPTWQSSSTLIDFDVDTTNDGGSTWTTQQTVTRTGNVSFTHGCDINNSGCKQETYWDEQWVFPVTFAVPITANGIRIHVRGASYGGEPDAAAKAAGGQGANTPTIALQEISVIPTTVSYAYQWTKDGANIAGQTSSTYTVTSGDSGHSIACKVTATTDGGSTTQASNSLSIVSPSPQSIGIPILS